MYAHFTYARYSCKVQEHVLENEVLDAARVAVQAAQCAEEDAVDYLLAVLDVADRPIAPQVIERAISLPPSQHSLVFGERRLFGGFALQVISREAQALRGTEYVVVLVSHSDENPL